VEQSWQLECIRAEQVHCSWLRDESLAGRGTISGTMIKLFLLKQASLNEGPGPAFQSFIFWTGLGFKPSRSRSRKIRCIAIDVSAASANSSRARITSKTSSAMATLHGPGESAHAKRGRLERHCPILTSSTWKKNNVRCKMHFVLASYVVPDLVSGLIVDGHWATLHRAQSLAG
jgi:hypothetical protein